MRRSAQLSLIHHLRQSSQSNVARIRNDESDSRGERGATSRNGWQSRGGGGSRRSYSLIFNNNNYHYHYPYASNRHFSTKTSPFANEKTSSSSKNTLNFDNIPGARVPKNAKPTRILEITKEQADEAIKSCLDLIRKHDRESYLTILAMPKAVQVELIAINALNVELAQIRDKVDTRRGDTSAMYRLQFWKDALASIFDASPLPVPRQPVAIALCVAASRTRQPELLAKLVQTRQATIGDKQFENIEAVAEYGRNTTGAILQLEIDVLSRGSGVDDKVFELARELGASYAIANLIRSTHPLLARGIVLLPRDIVELHGTSADAIYNKKKIEESRGVAKDLARESERILENVRDQIDQIPKDLRIVFAGHAISIDFILGTLKKKDFDLYSAFLQRPNGLMVWKLLCCKLTGRF